MVCSALKSGSLSSTTRGGAVSLLSRGQIASSHIVYLSICPAASSPLSFSPSLHLSVRLSDPAASPLCRPPLISSLFLSLSLSIRRRPLGVWWRGDVCPGVAAGPLSCRWRRQPGWLGCQVASDRDAQSTDGRRRLESLDIGSAEYSRCYEQTTVWSESCRVGGDLFNSLVFIYPTTSRGTVL